MMLVVEDAHWLDPTTSELLDRLVGHLPTARLMMVVASRPEFVPPWSDRHRAETRTLSRLSDAETRQLIDQVAADRKLPGEVASTILSRTEGVPLFVEELTKTILESAVADDGATSAGRSGAAVPTTLQGSLMARLDRLGAAKEVAQLAACIGREFTRELLAAIAERDAQDLDAQLRQLRRAELLFASDVEPAALFVFKHALIRDAAYESLLKSRRQTIHGRIADAIAQRFPTVADAEPELVAQHLTLAGQSEPAVTWWARAGSLSSRRSAFPEATRQFSRALDLLRQQPASRARDEQELSLLIELGPAVIHSRGWAVPELDPLYRRALDLARELDRPDMVLPSLVGRWQWFNLRGHYHRGLEVADETFRLAASTKDDSASLQAHHLAFPSKLWLGEVTECREHVASLLALYDEERHAGHRFVYMGHDPAVCAHAIEGTASWLVGNTDEGYRAASRACEHARRIAHAPSLAHALWLKAMLGAFARDPETALSAADEVLSLAREVKLAAAEASGQSFRGWALVQRGHLEEGVRLLEAGLSAWRAQQALQFMPHRLCLYAEGLLAVRRNRDALSAIMEALQLVKANHEAVLEPLVRLTFADILLAAGHTEQAHAEEQLSLALAQTSDRGFPLLALRIARRLSMTIAERGERARAYDLLVPVVEKFQGAAATRDGIEAKALLNSLR
jgi:predicted ATPase